MPFGPVLRESSFQFAENVNNLNHGSYGACPREVTDARINAMMSELSFPDKFYRYDLEPTNKRAREVFAKELNCDVEDVVCVPNATYGMNTVLRSLLDGNTSVVYFSTIYGSCKNVLLELEWEGSVKDLHQITVPLRIANPDDLVKALDGLLRKKEAWKPIVIFDTVTSMPSIPFPWEKLIQLCRQRSCISVVDGAHGIGLLDINLREAKPDFFMTNAHKWFYSAHSCAALYVDKKHQSFISNIVVGPVLLTDGELKEGVSWTQNFDSMGTVDRSAICAIPAAAKFREEVLGGSKSAIEYQNSLSKAASDYLCTEWNTTVVADFGEEYRTALFTIFCPYVPPEYQRRAFTEFANEYLCEHHKTYIPLILYQNQVVIRFSAAVYLDLDDFKVGKAAIDDTIKFWKDKYEYKTWVQ